MEEYPRYLLPNFKAFDPIELFKRTEEIVCKKTGEGQARKYTDFYATGVYGGIATGYAVGCCLRCIFCWVGPSREYPERFGEYYSPRQVFNRLREVAHKYKVRKLRISGAEPTIGKEHILSLLEYVESSEFPIFILETNGIILGVDKDYVRKLAKFKKVHVRVSLKAGTPKGFTSRTGAIGSFYELPFRAIRHLLDYGVSFHVACMSDSRLMDKNEREALLRTLAEIDKKLIGYLEEEICDPYEHTVLRLKKAGYDPRKFFIENKPIYR